MIFNRPTIKTAVEWALLGSVVPPALVECIESDTGRRKTGDGTTTFGSLPYDKTSSGSIETRTSDPSSPAVGDIWLRTDL